jgi:hypothetical protein
MASETIGLIDFDSRIPNLALMKLSTYYKAQGCRVHLNMMTRETQFPVTPDRIFCSVVFTKNRQKAAGLKALYPNIEFGGTGWDLTTELPAEIENARPDYDLYTAAHLAPRLGGIGTRERKLRKAEELANAGIGFTSRGCIRSCAHCFVPRKEGDLHLVGGVRDLVNPRSKTLILLNNNLTAQPNVLEELEEIRQLDLKLDITQGIDVRLMTPEIALALSRVSHVRSLHYAWDFWHQEAAIWRGIEILSKHIKVWRHLCFVLTGFNSSFEQDVYRFERLSKNGIDPYIMRFDPHDLRLKHFARWVNARIYKVCSFENYEPWVRVRNNYRENPLLMMTA